MAGALFDELQGIAADRDQIVVVSGVSWRDYDALLRARSEDARPQIAYLDGELEVVMTTSVRHELWKKLLARLVEVWAIERDVELVGMGQTTFRKRAKRAGAEPDECYSVGEVGAVPDLVLEIVHTHGGIDKLEIYRRLGVREVWCWIDRELRVYQLVGDRYQARTRSAVLKGIDLPEISRIARDTPDDRQTSAVRAYQRALTRRTR